MKKGQKISEETRRKMIVNNARKGRPGTMLGKKHTEESKRKNKLSHIGKKRGPHSEEAKKKISYSNTNPSIETRKKMSISAKVRKRFPRSEATKKKIGDSNRGKKKSIEHIRKNHEWHIQHPNKKFMNTLIELKMKDLIAAFGVEYSFQHPFSGVGNVDFYIPSKKLVIECDGCYWHGCPIHFPNRAYLQVADAVRDQKLAVQGIKTIRFWEHEINSMKILHI